jgi:curved DNA-binding protein CbpA
MSAQAATYYEILGVSRRARPDGVRAAYRRLAQQYHPDKMPGNARAEQVMAAINEAYAVLSDPQQRARYDERIEASNEHIRLARASFVARLEDHGAAWPWYLVIATVMFSAAAVGVSVYRNFVPATAVKVVQK